MIYHQSDGVTLHLGNTLDVLREMDSGSVQCIVTSPPYYGLRDYGVTGQIGLEASPTEYVETLRAIFAEVRRVLTDDGVCWLNIGDTYSTRTVVRDSSHQGGFHPDRPDHESISKTWVENRRTGHVRMPREIPEKNLIGVPWRLAFALQDDGWIIRNDIVWNKSNAMPQSVADRLSSRHEHLFLLSKSRRYKFNLDAIRESTVPQSGRAASFVRATKEAAPVSGAPRQHREQRPAVSAYHPKGKNPGDVWTIATKAYPAAHFATFPPALVQRCVLAGSAVGDTVLDPFVGSGTAVMVARQLGRGGVGIDLNSAYLDLSIDRLAAS